MQNKNWERLPTVPGLNGNLFAIGDGEFWQLFLYNNYKRRKNAVLFGDEWETEVWQNKKYMLKWKIYLRVYLE